MDVKTLIEKQKDVLESIGIPFEIIEYLVYYYLTNQTIYNKREGKFIYREDDDIVYSNFISDIEDGLFYRENAKHGIMDKRFYIFGELEGIWEVHEIMHGKKRLNRRARFQNGLRHGLEEFYTPSNLYTETMYKYGRKNGTYKILALENDERVIREQCEYLDGKKAWSGIKI